MHEPTQPNRHLSDNNLLKTLKLSTFVKARRMTSEQAPTLTASQLLLVANPHCQNVVTVSIVSHGHGAMVDRLVERLKDFPEVAKVVLIKNIQESLKSVACAQLHVHENATPLGFGANHNQAFALCNTEFFCVLNPDIELPENPFPKLIAGCKKVNDAAITAPLIMHPQGELEDSARLFPTPWSILRKATLGEKGITPIVKNLGLQATDWAAGMFLFFPSPVYQRLKGFDERYFLYYEDVDICWRAKQLGYSVLVNTDVYAVHAAQRASHRDFQHFFWHSQSMLRFFVTKLLTP